MGGKTPQELGSWPLDLGNSLAAGLCWFFPRQPPRASGLLSFALPLQELGQAAEPSLAPGMQEALGKSSMGGLCCPLVVVWESLSF